MDITVDIDRSMCIDRCMTDLSSFIEIDLKITEVEDVYMMHDGGDFESGQNCGGLRKDDTYLAMGARI